MTRYILTMEPNSSSPQYNVRLGVWANKSRGSILGATLTMNKQDASLIIAFVAIFIGYVGTRFWRIICVGLHRFHSSSQSRDVIHHQLQVTLRNSASAESTLSSLVKLPLAWHGQRARALYRVLPEVVLAICCLCAFVAAGGLSSRILLAGNEVILDAANCSYLQNSRSGADIYLAWQTETLSKAINYALNCYSSGIARDSLACDSYVVRELPTTLVDTTANCPFAGDICRSNTSNILLDTGYIDSNNHLGLNFASDDRILYRKVLHCAPIKNEGRNSSYKVPGFNYTRYDYGNGAVLALNYTVIAVNYTFEVIDRETQYREDYSRLGSFVNGGAFILDSTCSHTVNRTISREGQFYPDADLSRTDADLCLIFIAGNGVVFTEPTGDDWYRANTPCQRLIDVNNGRIVQYCADDAASSMACVQQYQVCNAKTSKCGPLASFWDALSEAADVFGATQSEISEAWDGGATNDAASRLIWFMKLLDKYPTNIGRMVKFSGPSSLFSRQNLANGVQRRLLPNQWQLDVTHWWYTTLALTQAAFVEAVRNTVDPKLAPIRVFPKYEAQQTMCMNQKIISPEHDSFSLFGVLFTFIFGILITVISYVLEPFLAYINRRFRHKPYSHLEWVSNGTLQLQRLAHEGVDSQDWSRCDEDVPITEAGRHLGCLDITDLGHPRLSRPTHVNTEGHNSLSGSRHSTALSADEASHQTDHITQISNQSSRPEYHNDSDDEIVDEEHRGIELWGPLQTR
ncbi:hypothetical protein GGR52DRAFT_143822 [Hypoxylon sp. FL1284]|nr:hypothetical protein GGR52DRAFT_143822 [Hypoxylon sp. FL1284]